MSAVTKKEREIARQKIEDAIEQAMRLIKEAEAVADAYQVPFDLLIEEDQMNGTYSWGQWISNVEPKDKWNTSGCSF